MKSNAPWSVKGIERDARETAKEAARREGMTVGEWLNQMIYSQAEGGGSELSGGEVQGLKLRDIVTAIEHLRNRVVDAENKNAAAVSDLSRNMGGFVERVQRLERVKPAEGSNQDLTLRLEKLERAGNDRGRIDALKALEKAVAQVAVQFNNAQRTTLTRLDSAEAQLQEFAARIDHVGDAGAQMEPAEVGPLKSAIEDLAARVSKAERIAEEAANLKTEAADSTDPEFVERTGARLRVLGDEIKRGGDQIRTLEGTIAKLSNQIEAAEKRSADGVQKVSETIAEVRNQLLDEEANSAPDVEAMLSAARGETEEKLEALQRSLKDMNARFDELGRAEAFDEAAPTTAVEDVEPAPEAANTDEPASAADITTDEALEDDALDEVVDEIEEAVAAIEAEDNDSAEEDPFAFADEDTETPVVDAEEGELLEAEASDEPADDFSFQLDDEAEDDGEDDITVSAEEESEDEDAGEAESLLAEVRSALTGEGADDEDIHEDSANDENEIAPSSIASESLATKDDLEEDEEEDRQAPNTASLASSMAVETASSEEAGTADETDNAPVTKEDMLQAARRRAREAAGRDHEESENRPRRSQLTAKQRAILAARARQKNAEQEASTEETDAADDAPASAFSDVMSETSGGDLANEQPVASAATAEEEADEPSAGGRFGKITAALASAKARLGRNKGEDAPSETAADAEAATSEEVDEGPRRNGDRAAFETLRSTTSAKPLTIALGVAILLAVAALVYLVKDFVFKPDTGAAPSTPAVEHTEPAASTAHTEEANLPTVPEAPAIDPQALYIESMDALGAAASETDAMAAITKLQDAAALGYPPAQLQLGELYKTGQGVDQDLGQARVWFRRAANGGNVLAMHRIGVMTARGDGGPADSQEAIAWFEQAANYGLVDSQYNLGAIYHPSEDGGSLVQDAGKAYYWYSLASHNGDEQAAPLAGGVAVALSPQERDAIDAEVAAWTAQSADESANLNANAG